MGKGCPLVVDLGEIGLACPNLEYLILLHVGVDGTLAQLPGNSSSNYSPSVGFASTGIQEESKGVSLCLICSDNKANMPNGAPSGRAPPPLQRSRGPNFPG